MRSRALICCAMLAGMAPAGAAESLPTRGGDWQVGGRPPVIRQADSAAEAAAWVPVAGGGPCWRLIAEAGPFAGSIGVRWGTSDLAAPGWGVELTGSLEGEVLLRDPAGTVLWRDHGIGWCAYVPLWVEAVEEKGRVRVQVLAADRETLLAQSPWFPSEAAASGTGGMTLFTAGNTARFCLAERGASPLAEFSPDNPSALRVPAFGDTAWAVIGGGSWRWRDGSRQVLLSTRPVERTTAFLTAPAPAEGTWRCRVRLDRGTCGGGLLVHADRDLGSGFLAWLGGTYGDGCFMLYRYPLECLWAGSQGVWKWDTDYVIEVTLRGGALAGRLLGADGVSVVAESPAIPIAAEKAPPPGMTGFQTWRGTGAFSQWTTPAE